MNSLWNDPLKYWSQGESPIKDVACSLHIIMYDFILRKVSQSVSSAAADVSMRKTFLSMLDDVWGGKKCPIFYAISIWNS